MRQDVKSSRAESTSGALPWRQPGDALALVWRFAVG
jgi:hypothetical protein